MDNEMRKWQTHAKGMDRPMNLTTTYILASKHLCRSSCVIPAAILKGLEIAADIFLPGPIAIEFIEGTI
jgi:hypothetical protein